MIGVKAWKAIGVGITGFAGAMLIGITKVVDLSVDTNLFNTGITPGMLLGAGLIVVAIAIYKNRI